MANYEIRHEVGIAAAPAALYHALTDARQLALWWIPDTRGASEPGSALEFWLGEHCQEMRVTALERDRLVCWRATDKGMPDWAGTEIEFALVPRDDRTTLRFRHAGWRGSSGESARPPSDPARTCPCGNADLPAAAVASIPRGLPLWRKRNPGSGE